MAVRWMGVMGGWTVQHSVVHCARFGQSKGSKACSISRRGRGK